MGRRFDSLLQLMGRPAKDCFRRNSVTRNTPVTQRMKLAAVVISLFGILMLAGAQQPKAGEAAGPAPSIGLEVGSKVPAFELRDQNGQKQSNETLKGANGTILLFFRSADW